MRLIRPLVAAAAITSTLMMATTTVDAAPSAPTGAKGGNKASGSTFRSLGVNSFATRQPTASGRRIVDLEMFEGNLYAGFGDWSQNTGPIQISSLDPTNGAVTPRVLADTEAVHNLRTINGRLVAPATDPRVAADYAVDAPWENHAVVSATHVFDMTTFDGNDLWMVGSKGTHAMAWRSLDGGATWAAALDLAPLSADASDFARFWGVGVLNSRLYVQGYDAVGGNHPTSKVFDGTSWSDGPALAASGLRSGPMWKPVVLGTSLIYRTAPAGGHSPVEAFDGTTTHTIASAYDVEVANDRLYVLDSRFNVRSTSDLATWTTIAAAPRGSLSLAVGGNEIFIGTRGSEILAFRAA